MTFIAHLINKRIANLISRFDLPQLPPHMVEKIVIDNIKVEREAKTTD
tara:strand:+ start:2195 stop:2338 length:144 start_codon:yes stop_codon:yes gene_type:complete